VNAEVLTIGTELLLGQIIDTNASYLGKKLAEAGVNLYFKTNVGDNIARVKEALKIAVSRADVVIITGGLGPTVDDITRQALSEFTSKKLISDKASLEKLTQRFVSRGVVMTENNKSQACFPEGAIIVNNDNGTAPGFIIEDSSKIFAAMPGVPAEMYPMMENDILPYLIRKQGSSGKVIKSKSLRIVGMGESIVDDKIEDLFRESKNPSIGIYAHMNEIEIRLTAKADNADEALRLINGLKKIIYTRLGDNIFGEDDETLEEKTASLLIGQKIKVATAESCTSGLLSYMLTNVPGSSAYYTGGINVYSNEAKTDVLGIDPEIIKKYGAVSPECAENMAKEVVKKFRADVGISITGIAGPGGATENKPVGLVYIGMYFKGVSSVHKFNFIVKREGVRSRSAYNAMLLLYMELKKQKAVIDGK
jgi:nicotinamide-nucleotide amidase